MENILKLLIPLIIFILGIGYKLFEIKYLKKREIEENEIFIKSWLNNFSKTHSKYKDRIQNLRLKDPSIYDIIYPNIILLTDNLLNQNTSTLFNIYITNRKISRNNLNEYITLFYKFITNLKHLDKNLLNYESILNRMIQSKIDSQTNIEKLHDNFDSALSQAENENKIIADQIHQLIKEAVSKLNIEPEINNIYDIQKSHNKEVINYLNKIENKNSSTFNRNLLKITVNIDIEYEKLANKLKHLQEELNYNIKNNEEIIEIITNYFNKLVSNNIRSIFFIK